MAGIIKLTKMSFMEVYYKASIILHDPRYQGSLKLCSDKIKAESVCQNEIIEKGIQNVIKSDISPVNNLVVNQKQTLSSTLTDLSSKVGGTSENLNNLSGSVQPEQAEVVVTNTLKSIGELVRMNGDVFQSSMEQANQLAQLQLMDGGSLSNSCITIYTAIAPIIGS
jgi:hypothetical protein